MAPSRPPAARRNVTFPEPGPPTRLLIGLIAAVRKQKDCRTPDGGRCRRRDLVLKASPSGTSRGCRGRTDHRAQVGSDSWQDQAVAYGLFGSFTATPGMRDELVGYLLRAAGLMRANPECLLYLVATTEKADEVAVTEVWTDEAAHAASLQEPGVPELIAQARPVIAGVAGPTRLSVRGGKGLDV